MAKQYVVRFENGNRVATIACDNDTDLVNKMQQANDWAKAKNGREALVLDDNRADIKLDDGKIKQLTKAEIAKKENKPVTLKEQFLKMLDDEDIKAKIKAL